MSIINVSVDVTGLIPAGAFDERVFPNVAHAVKRLAERGHELWQGYASGVPLPSGKTIKARSGGYLRSIKVEPDGDLAYRVFSDASYAKAIEEGTPERDLKKMLRTSTKVRATSKGRLYLIIPFRWGTPGTTMAGPRNTMAADLYDEAKRLAPSRVTGIGQRLSARGHIVPQRRYRWGGRLPRVESVQEPMASRAEGMVKMQESKRHTSYLTFRTMMEGSSGWIAPAREGLWPSKTVADKLREIATEAIRNAAMADRDAALQESAG